jgi:hypothetical protein
MFAINGVEAMSGFDLAKAVAIRGQYKTRKKAYEIVDERFNKSTDLIFSRILGKPSNNIKKAKRGDIVRFTQETGRTYGLVDESGRRFAAMGPKGVYRLALNKAECFWGVG